MYSIVLLLQSLISRTSFRVNWNEEGACLGISFPVTMFVIFEPISFSVTLFVIFDGVRPHDVKRGAIERGNVNAALERKRSAVMQISATKLVDCLLAILTMLDCRGRWEIGGD